ncbi:DUF805 domain-containing protein [Pseudohoeflea coraliihabitans]|uniref:DUF805 domain-containing protein n=1 Tax=Pseudohoeflea coraliihabitans TaxID=2860393 RepID=A0ABS6WIP0_9HYPH|nr:DUF805 domain-containing protein [Pseudohoeflea sp. DP4N28-3]MBW3095725.1 DUF805 domain-containing protein [Pseudohoeflea sp. DP4N28-3]
MDQTRWYYAENNERRGPVAEQEAALLVRDGIIGPNTLVWSEGMSDWAPADTAMPHLFAGTAGATAAPGQPPHAGTTAQASFPPGDQGPLPSHPTDFVSSVKTVLSKYATFTGRARRPEYWWYVLFYFVGGLVTGFLDGLLFGAAADFSPLNTIFTLALIIPSIAVTARRLHDIGRSGWWQLIWFIPLVGWIVMIYWTTRRGDELSNRYGPA